MGLGLSLRRATDTGVPVENAEDVDFGTGSQYLTFRLGAERFAVPILSILEIIEYQPPVPVPGLPPLFCGVIDLRETAVPVIELASCLKRPVGAISKRTCILIVEAIGSAEQWRVGFIVDSVNEVMDIAADTIAPPPVIGSISAEPYLLGTGRVPRDPFDVEDSEVIVLVDFEPLIAMFASADPTGLEAA
ncbi:MAG: hypothetical protein RIS59_278 [Pseudomonadota bacterium]